MNIINRILALSFSLAMLASTHASAAGHTGYLAPANCAWYDLICQYNQNAHRYDTKYPVVLVHGVSGFDKLLGLVEYFKDIPATLRGGGAYVYTPNVTAWDDPYTRGEQLISYLTNTVLPQSGATKVNLIGHSLGGPTIRYVASVRPDLVASVTTVNGTNHGSKFADWGMTNFPQGSAGNAAIATLLNLLGAVTDFLAGAPYDQNSLNAVLNMTTEGSTTFNNLHPQGQPTSWCGQGAEVVNGIRYYSWGSTGTYTDPVNPMAYLLVFTGTLGFTDSDNDGLVARCSMHWGTVIRDDYFLNHTDATNLFGMHIFSWDNPVSNYTDHANRLRALNL